MIILFYAHTQNIPQEDLDALNLELENKKKNLVYFIENKNSNLWLDKSENGTTNIPADALTFEGKDAKAMANLYLYLLHQKGALSDFIVTEHLFIDRN